MALNDNVDVKAAALHRFIEKGGYTNPDTVDLRSGTNILGRPRRYNGRDVFGPEVSEIRSGDFRYGENLGIRFSWVRLDTDRWEFQSSIATIMTTEELRALFKRGIFNPEYSIATYPQDELRRSLWY